MSTEAVLDDEMEAMLREIEDMGMTPDAPAAAAPAPEPAPAIETTDDAIEALAAMLTDDIEDIAVTEAPAAAVVEEDDMEAMVAAIEAEAKAAPVPAAAPKVTAADLAKKRLKTEGYIVTEKEAAHAVESEKVHAAAAEVDATADIAKAVEAVVGPTPTDPENVVVKPKPAPASAATASSTDDILDTEQIKKDIAINPTDLDNALIQHPGLQMHYALKTAGARRAYERLKSGVEILEARLDSSYREKLGDGVKKPTEAAIRNAVVGDPAYAAAQAKLIDAQHLWKMCEAVESSFHSRKDILLEVARDRRKEREGAMRVLDDTGLRERVLAGMTK
jgi:hypothetical protein